MKAASPQVNFPELEVEILNHWEKNQTFQKSNDQRRAAKEYFFYDGPPFANGLPHYGHLLANTIKDTVPRYWNMRGYFVERRFGWDCHGVPVEYEIEKTHQLKGRQDILRIGVAKFNELCRSSVQHYAKEWQKTITRLGRWVDWNHQYHTMDKDFMESVWWVLSELHKKGLLYKSHKVVSYSPRLSAVLSNFEANQNYKDVQDPSVTIKFKLMDEPAYFLAWTTTPWTLISNLGLVVSPEVVYVKVKDKTTGEIYILAGATVEKNFNLKSKDQKHDIEIMERMSGKSLKGKKYQPLFPYFKNTKNTFVVLADPYVTLNEGTGIVHAAPAFGEDDYRVCLAHGIGLVDPLDNEGCFFDIIPEYKGLFVKDADKLIIKRLKDEGKLFKHDTIVHSYPHCERTEGPLIYRAIPAWYVAVEKIRDQVVANNKLIRWVPEHLRDGRMGKWLENARDWAISRNRFWGTPLPIWLCNKSEHHVIVIGSVKQLEDKTKTKISDLHKEYIDPLTFPCEQCSGTMHRVPEVFDCWFESGSMPYAQHHYPFEHKDEFLKHFPADFIAEGQDQTRGWFYTLSILSTALFGKPAFKNVVVNGMILAEDGKKMSKRLKNYTPPDDLLQKFGADSVRLYMLNSPVLRAEDLRFSDNGVRDLTRAVLLPLWNAYSFLSTYAEADHWQPELKFASGEAPPSENELDRWIISRFQSLTKAVHEQMEKYLLYNVVPNVLAFIDELTNWYIRLSRRRFWGESQPGQVKPQLPQDTRRAYETLFYILTEFTKVFAPFAPFLSDAIYRRLTDGIKGAKESVHLCDIPPAKVELILDKLEDQMALVRIVTNLGRSLRAKHQIKTRQVLREMMVITRHQTDKQYIEASKALICEELNLKNIIFTTEEKKYVRLSLKPNLKSLGPKLGKKLSLIKEQCDQINQSHEKVSGLLDELAQHGYVKVLDESLAEEDFLIERSSKDQRLIATEQGVTVLLDTTLTDDLIREGLAREVVNRVQNLRKDSGLKVTDRIHLNISADEKLREAINQHAEYIGGETLALTVNVITPDQHLKDAQFCQRYEINGLNCNIGISVSH